MEALNGFDPDDIVTDVLRNVRLRGTIYCRSILRFPWGFSVPARQAAAFHFVASGGCQLEVEGVEGTTQLARRDLVVLPNGNRHTLRDGPGSPARWLDEVLAEHPLNAKGDFEYGGDGARTTLICGGFFVEGLHANPLLASLPPVLHITGAQGQAVPWLGAALDWIESEVDARSPGSEAITTRLSEILFIEATRAYYARSDGPRSGWLLAIVDPQIGAALALIHHQPEARWSVDSLAERLTMSRSSFSAKFDQLVGEPPLHYVTRCRLNKAAGLLRMTRAKVAEVAHMVGYNSEAAFSKAFKRIFHVGPGEFRRGVGAQRMAATPRRPDAATAQIPVHGMGQSPDERLIAGEPS
jgi:AraC-like DNA-binding protein